MGGRTWDWHDKSGTYQGGYQADENFERAYGKIYLRRHHGARSGYWSPWEQTRMALYGAKMRGGFNPWPSTRITCGLPAFF